MLKKISPLISPELLKILAEMGHGDVIAFGDAFLRNPAKLRMWCRPMDSDSCPVDTVLNCSH